MTLSVTKLTVHLILPWTVLYPWPYSFIGIKSLIWKEFCHRKGINQSETLPREYINYSFPYFITFSTVSAGVRIWKWGNRNTLVSWHPCFIPRPFAPLIFVVGYRKLRSEEWGYLFSMWPTPSLSLIPRPPPPTILWPALWKWEDIYWQPFQLHQELINTQWHTMHLLQRSVKLKTYSCNLWIG